MGEEKPEPLDFVKDFQEYLSQQTQHVNMISGSVIGVKDSEDLQGGNASRTFLCVVLDLTKMYKMYQNVVLLFYNFLKHVLCVRTLSYAGTYHDWDFPL